ncbi:putative Proteophosphoglycan-related [Quillaja saponaria]|uniref:Proteophosphoglycan-related n=1 Tax=Quillaja saponaria TaxID=32244 RepID=A0AAD7KYQ5_QUISA|nr:putative Proteophosphoglycan-related [Quillaja saponaria]
MAKNNKYTAINFNHIYDKNPHTNSTTHPTKNPSPSSSSSPSYSAASYSAISSPNKTHGRMLVLTRPTPKPVTTTPLLSPQPQQQQTKQTHQIPDQSQAEPVSDAISLRPLGRTGTGSSLSSPVLNLEREKELAPPLISPKPNKFVPPHLRPGFVAKEEKPGPEVFRSRDSGYRQQGHTGSPGFYGEEGRPKSGGNPGFNMGMVSRPRSSGSRPGSSG